MTCHLQGPQTCQVQMQHTELKLTLLLSNEGPQCLSLSFFFFFGWSVLSLSNTGSLIQLNFVRDLKLKSHNCAEHHGGED